LAEPADHLLLVAPEREFGELIRAEIHEATGHEPDACSVSVLQQNPSVAIGAVLVTPSYYVAKIEATGLADRIVVPVSYSPADEHFAAISRLPQASVIGVVSVSALFLETANGLFGAAIGSRHSFREFLLCPAGASNAGEARLKSYVASENTPDIEGSWAVSEKGFRYELSTSQGEIGTSAETEWLSSVDLGGVDLLFCDSLADAKIKHKRKVKYRLLSSKSLDEIDGLVRSMIRGAPHARYYIRPGRRR
jgi:hypothetical protein